MSTNIAFLSGKGGSGKTTLALSIADLLSRCKIKTLLIDCDLSTNGATYFYESRLSNSEFGITSFEDLLNRSDLFITNKDFRPLMINTFLDFIPSVSRFTTSVLSSTDFNWDWDKNPHHISFLDGLLNNKNGYDVILFDCQAGYTDILKRLLPNMDVDLFVLEADSISASAMRSLHLKIGNYLGRAKLYQVFNKATPEEFEIYSKIVGTFFVNIGTLLFDWKIRQAFSRSLVPDLENTSAKYGADLCEICKIMLAEPDINEKLSSFASMLNIKRLEESKDKLMIEAKNAERYEHALQRLITRLKRAFLIGLLSAVFTFLSLKIIDICIIAIDVSTRTGVTIVVIFIVVYYIASLIYDFYNRYLKSDDVFYSSEYYNRAINELETKIKSLSSEVKKRE